MPTVANLSNVSNSSWLHSNKKSCSNFRWCVLQVTASETSSSTDARRWPPVRGHIQATPQKINLFDAFWNFQVMFILWNSFQWHFTGWKETSTSKWNIDVSKFRPLKNPRIPRINHFQIFLGSLFLRHSSFHIHRMVLAACGCRCSASNRLSPATVFFSSNNGGSSSHFSFWSERKASNLFMGE